MDILDFIFNPFLILFMLFIFIPLLRYLWYRREEEEFYNRMYWTMRDAQEDAQRHKQDKDNND